MPLAERRRAVAVVAQDPGQRRAVPRQDRASSRGTRPRARRSSRTRPRGCSAPSAAKPESASTARSRGSGCSAGLARPCGCSSGLDRAAEGAGVAESRVVDQDQQHVGCAFRRRRMRDQVPVRLRPVERLADTPANASRRIGRLLRSSSLIVSVSFGVAAAGCARLGTSNGRVYGSPRALPVIVDRQHGSCLIPRGWSCGIGVRRAATLWRSMDRGGAVGYVELAVDRPDVGLEGVDRDVELGGHLAVGHAQRQHAQAPRARGR